MSLPVTRLCVTLRTDACEISTATGPITMTPLLYALCHSSSHLTASAPPLIWQLQQSRKLEKVTGGAADSAYHRQLIAGELCLRYLCKIQTSEKTFLGSLAKTNKSQIRQKTIQKLCKESLQWEYSGNAIWPSVSVPSLCCLTAWGHVPRMISCRLAAPPNKFISLNRAGSCQVSVK